MDFEREGQGEKEIEIKREREEEGEIGSKKGGELRRGRVREWERGES